MDKYNPKQIEPKWQEYWARNDFYRAEDFSLKPKKYILIEFPYPSGDGLHVGHTRSYSALDAVARKKRMEGFNVLFPFGWDAFGLPAENYAIKIGKHPREATEKNIANYKRQLKSLGLSFDWTREVNTTEPGYYRWTQWIFLKLFKKGLAYQAEMPINWCSSCKIGLANEEVVGGNCERCGKPVSKKVLKQWMLKITAYADRLIDDLKNVDFPEKVKSQQINWIGRSEGVQVDFRIEGLPKKVSVFTTRADTLFGVTAVVLAPENPLVKEVTIESRKEEVGKYVREAERKSDFERVNLEKEKTGVFTGSYCLNPVNGKKVPIWLGDYVISSYGGGAVMVVPAHDKRDYEFAKKYSLAIKEVVSGGDISKQAFVDYGRLVNSGEFNGLRSGEAIEKITEWLEKNDAGRRLVQYKLRDWIFSRQHYWGEPIPVIHCQKCGIVPVPEKDLPVELPYVEKYQPTGTGESPLSAVSEWVNVECPKCQGRAKRETDTMPNWAGSNWYYMRYCDPGNNEALADEKKLKYWLPVDWYNGGFEHTTLHLLYSRFIYKFLYDIGLAPSAEAYSRRTSHGIVLAEDNRKMSKSFGNVVNPDHIVEEFGADTLRLYEMFMGPFDQAIAWSTQGVKGCYRFLEKTWNIVLSCMGNSSAGDKKDASLKALHRLNKKINEDLEVTKFNTIIAAFMEFINLCQEKKQEIKKPLIEKFLILLAPFAPHIAEELWQKLGHKESVFLKKWPQPEEKFLKDELIILVIQINGRVRDKIEAKSDISKEEAEKLTLARKNVKKWTAGKEIKKIIFVPKKLINIVL